MNIRKHVNIVQVNNFSDIHFFPELVSNELIKKKFGPIYKTIFHWPNYSNISKVWPRDQRSFKNSFQQNINVALDKINKY